MELTDYIQRRLAESLEIVRVLSASMNEDAETDMRNALLVKTRHKENPGLKAENVSRELGEMFTSGKNYFIKNQEILKHVPIISELKTMAEIFKIAVEILEEDKEFYQNVTTVVNSVYTVDKGKLVYALPEIEKQLNQEFDAFMGQPQNIEKMFQSIIARK